MTHNHGQRHAGKETGHGRFGRVEIAMRIDPDQAAAGMIKT
jgi:hypothetical protein